MIRYVISRIRGNLFPEVKVRELFAWSFYDFANSGFSTVVITAVFSAYFVQIVAGDADWATLLWTASLSLSYLVIMFTAPVLGIIADSCRAKKRFLFITTLGCGFFTIMLSIVGQGDVFLAVALIVIANFFFGTGENIIAAFLPELARPKSLGKVSGWGWAIGYLGGLFTLTICLLYLTSEKIEDARVSHTMIITGIVFLLASTPTFMFLKERGKKKEGIANNLRDGYRLLKVSLSNLKSFYDLKIFLICLVIYQAGIQAVITLAAVYANQAMGFSTADTISLILVVNVTASIGAFVFGQFEDRVGHKFTLSLTLIGWVLTVVIAYYSVDRNVFWIAANLAGICLGASQSAGRALVAYFSPSNQEGEFLGLWGLAVKCSSILGPITYGIVVWLSEGNHRQALLSLVAYFIVGLIILSKVKVERGRELAVYISRSEKLE